MFGMYSNSAYEKPYMGVNMQINLIFGRKSLFFPVIRETKPFNNFAHRLEVLTEYHSRGGEKRSLRIETPGPSLGYYVPHCLIVRRINEVKTGESIEKPTLAHLKNRQKQRPAFFTRES